MFRPIQRHDRRARKARPYSRAAILAGLFVLCGLFLAGCQLDDLQPRRAATATPAATPLGSLPAGPLVQSPPSLGFDRLLAAAREKIGADYPDAVLYSISAEPYDYEYGEDYVPAHEILRVTFEFIRPNLDCVSVDMPDDVPAAALHIDVSHADREDPEDVRFWQAIYSDTLKYSWGLERDLRNATISPRDAISLTRQDALQRAQQVGLKYRGLLPEVSLLPPDERPTAWEVVYEVQSTDDDEYAYDRQPLATYILDIVDASIVSREYTDAVPYSVAYAPTWTAEALTASPTPATPEPTSTPLPLVTAEDYFYAAQLKTFFDHAEAIRLYSEAIRLDPKMAKAYRARAAIYRGDGEYELAISDYTTLLESGAEEISAEDASDLYHARGLVYLEKGQEEARPEDIDRAIEDFNRALVIDLWDARVYFDRGNAYLDKGDNDKALADYGKALDLDSEYTDAYFNRGLAYGRQQQWEKAIAEYGKYLAVNPHDKDAYYQRGLAYERSGQGYHAVEDFTQVIRLDGDNSDAYRLRGYSYYQVKRDKEAISDFDTAIRLNPWDAYAYRGRGFAYMRTGGCGQAIEDFSMALKLNEKDDFMYEFRGWCYIYTKQYDLAIADFDRHLEIRPDLKYLLLGRAWANEELGNHDRAIADASMSLEDSPCPQSAYVVRAIAHAAKGEYEAAFEDLERADTDCGTKASVEYGRGRIYAMQGKTAEATEALNKAIEGSGDDTITKQRAEKELKKLRQNPEEK